MKKVFFLAVLIIILLSFPVSASLVSHWSFDGNLNDVQGSNDGIFYGGSPSFVQGKISQALELDGTDDYVEVSHDSSLNVNSALTVSAWVKMNDNNAIYPVVVKAEDLQSGFYFAITYGTLFFRVANSGSYSDVRASYPNNNDWHHITGVFDGTTEKLYIDGNQVKSEPAEISSIASGSSVLRIGRSTSGYFGGDSRLYGIADEIKIFNHALSSQEVLDEFNQNTGGEKSADLNDDGVVGIADLIIVASNFGLTSGFDSRADTDGNEVIDIFDIVFIASNFGTIEPPPPPQCTGSCMSSSCGSYDSCSSASGECSSGYCCSGSCTSSPPFHDAPPIDPDATMETRNLLESLKMLAPDYLIYGQHHAYFLGNYVDGSGTVSDTQHITGSHPGVVGFDLNRIDQWSATSTDTGFHRQTIAHYRRGGIVTYSWHAPNPVTDGNANDISGNPVQQILEVGNPARDKYMAMLDDVSDFFNNLETDGTSVPIIWRPFHENTGSWFWWGADHCTAQEFQELWQFTVEYMRDVRGVHNLLWAYSPSKPNTVSEYLERYPGDDYVDIIGFDCYGDADTSTTLITNVREGAQTVTSVARERGKVAAATESGEKDGFANTLISDWFTRIWLDTLQDNPSSPEIAYVMTWYSPDWSAFQEGPNAHLYDDFISFYDSPTTLFAGDLPNVYGTSLPQCSGTCKPSQCSSYDSCASTSGECSSGYCCSGSCTTPPPPPPPEEDVVNAAGCSRDQIQAAVNSASAGDTVMIPACTNNNFVGTVTFSANIKIRGAGKDATVLARGSANTANLFVARFTGDNQILEFSDLTLRGVGDEVTLERGLRIGYDGTDRNEAQIKIYDCRFEGFGYYAIFIERYCKGVVYNCEFADNFRSGYGYGVYITGTRESDSMMGDWAYDTLPLVYGGEEFVFIEDSTFGRHRHSVPSSRGGRYVFRYNTITGSGTTDAGTLDVHGIYPPPGNSRSGRAVEIYENTVNLISQINFVQLAGADGVIFDNTITGDAQPYVMFRHSCCGGNTCGPYPEPDQTTDLYVWGNDFDGSSENDADVRESSQCYDEQEDLYIRGRDYYFTARPGYTPYTYPHPLRSS